MFAFSTTQMGDKFSWAVPGIGKCSAPGRVVHGILNTLRTPGIDVNKCPAFSALGRGNSLILGRPRSFVSPSLPLSPRREGRERPQTSENQAKAGRDGLELTDERDRNYT